MPQTKAVAAMTHRCRLKPSVLLLGITIVGIQAPLPVEAAHVAHRPSALTDRANGELERSGVEGSGEGDNRERAPWRTRTRSLDHQPPPAPVAISDCFRQSNRVKRVRK